MVEQTTAKVNESEKRVYVSENVNRSVWSCPHNSRSQTDVEIESYHDQGDIQLLPP